MNREKSAAGYTLVEVSLALVVGLVLLGVIYAVVESGQKSSVALDRKMTAQQDVRAALQVMALEIGMSSYNANYATGLWVNTACGNSPPTDATYKGIQEATANSVTIEMDHNESSSIGDQPNEVIRYAYLAGNQYITRDTNCLGAQPFLGDDPASGRPRGVRVINDRDGNGAYDDGVDLPVFTYFDGAGNQIPFASLPASIPSIRRVDITLQVETDEIAPDTLQRRRMIYSTSVIPINHGLGG